MMITKTGATYLIITDQAPAGLKGAEMRTSSISVFGLMIQPTKMQVSNATIGINTEFEKKSAKSSSELPAPSGSMKSRML